MLGPPPLLPEPNGSATTFLFQAWHEQFDPFAPDTYQPRLLCLRGLIEELAYFSRQTQHDPRWAQHVRLIQEEIKAVAAQESRLYARHPRSLWQARSIAAEADATELERHCRVWSDLSPTFGSLVTAELLVAVLGLPKEKRRALQALRWLGSHLLSLKTSTRTLQYTPSPSDFLLSPTEVASLFLRHINDRTRRYSLHMAVVGDRGALESVTSGTKFKLAPRAAVARNAPEYLRAVDDLCGRSEPHLSPNARIAHVILLDVDATSSYKAADESLRQLRLAVDVFNFYQTAPALAPLPLVYAQSPGEPPELLNLLSQSLRALRPRKAARALSRRVLMSVSDGPHGELLANALEHYSLALRSTDAKIQLTNLWTAMECLIRTRSGQSIGSTIAETVSAIVTWRRIERVLRYLAICLHEHGIGRTLRPTAPLFTAARWQYLPPELLLLAFAAKRHEPAVRELLALSSASPLLSNRVSEVAQAFSNTNELRKELAGSRSRVQWQLMRIYRARNLIMHTGTAPDWTPQLVDNLHYYFSMIVSRFLHDMTLHHGWTIDESCSRWKAHFAFVFDQLQQDPAELCVRDLIPNPTGHHEARPWI